MSRGKQRTRTRKAAAPEVPWPTDPAPLIGAMPAAAPVTEPLTATIGDTGLKRYGPWIYEEFHPKLAGRRAVLVYREMADNDAIIGSFLYAIEALMRQAPWRFEPAGQTTEQLSAKDFIESCFEDMAHTWDDLLSEILTLLPFGWSYFETVYKYRQGPDNEDPSRRSKFDDGKIGLRKISIRSQDSLDGWVFDVDGGIKGMWQFAPATGKRFYVPIEKALLFRTKTNKNNPEGRSLLRNCYRSWWYLKRIQEIEAIGIERELNGIPVVNLPVEIMSPTATAAQQGVRTKYETLVQQIRTDERQGIVFPAETDREGKPTGYKLSLLSVQGRGRAIDTNQIITRYEQREAMAVLAEFIFLGTGQSGSFALADAKTELFGVALRSIMKSICTVINRHLIPRLCALNGMPEEVHPRMVHGDVAKPDLKAAADFVVGLVNSGVINPDPSLERKMREVADLPEADADSAAEALRQRAEDAGLDDELDDQETGTGDEPEVEDPNDGQQPQPPAGGGQGAVPPDSATNAPRNNPGAKKPPPPATPPAKPPPPGAKPPPIPKGKARPKAKP